MAEKKEYRSAVRSRRLIRQAFLELLREKPLEKITVTDIVKRADINRSTFYAHYPDVRGLAEVLMDETIDSSLKLVREVEFGDIFSNPMPFLSELAAIGEQNIEIYRLLGQSDFALRQLEKLKTVIVEKSVTAVDVPEHIRNSKTFKIHISFFVGGIFNTYQQWMTGNLDCSTQEIMQQVANLLVRTEDIYLNWKEP